MLQNNPSKQSNNLKKILLPYFKNNLNGLFFERTKSTFHFVRLKIQYAHDAESKGPRIQVMTPFLLETRGFEILSKNNFYH